MYIFLCLHITYHGLIQVPSEMPHLILNLSLSFLFYLKMYVDRNYHFKLLFYLS